MVANISNIQQVYNTIPSRFIFEDVTYDNYQLLTDLHYNHGWRNVIIPEITQFQKLGNDYILLDDIVTKLVIDLTPEEIAEANKQKVPQTISAMRLKLQLFDMGIADQDIFDDIDSIPEVMFSTAEKEKAKIMYKTATSFERTDGKLNLVATMEGLTPDQLDEIFINGNKL